MKTIKNLAWGVLAALALAPMLQTQITQAAPFGSAFTYQGRLNFSGAPALDGLYDFRFTLHDAATLGSPIGSAVPVNAVPVTNGLFTVPLDFLTTPFTSGEARWLQLQVNTNGITPLVTLNPRQRITPTPQALYAGSATTAATAATASSVAAGAVTSAGLAPGSVNGTAIADGSITTADLSSSLLSNTFWNLAGNIGTTPGGNFIGTADNQPLEIRANNFRALRLEPRGSGSPPSLVGGYHNNTAGSFSGVAIAGGGTSGSINQVAGDYAFIGAGHGGYPGHFAAVVGGAYNTSLGQFSFVGTGERNTNLGLYAAIVAGSTNAITALADHAFIGGGHNNIANNTHATVGGGEANRASSWATVGGGRGNQADGAYATVAGGRANSSGGTYATVPGGYLNSAVGANSLAAGTQAKANHQGSFVWADSQNADFASTVSNQFLIRAAGNVGINKPNPATALDVNGTVTATGFSGSGAGLTSLNGSQLTSGTVNNLALASDAVDGAKILNGSITSADLNASLLNTTFWKLAGNDVAPGQFIGSTNNQPLEFKVNNQRGLRLEPTVDAPNVIGGLGGNYVAPGLFGATIGGGGFGNNTNKVEASVGTIAGGSANTVRAGGAFIGGGFGNLINSNLFDGVISGGKGNTIEPGASYSTIAGGAFNRAAANEATVAGGAFNSALGFSSTVGGGGGNTVRGDWATIAGGRDNTSSNQNATVGGGAGNLSAGFAATVGGGADNINHGNWATVGGGLDNISTGQVATVPGGHYNSAGGNFSFAAGNRAKANHNGAFVWADATDADFASTAIDQFSIRARGGIQIDPLTSQFFGSQTRQFINVYGAQYGIGVQSDTLYFRCDTTANGGFIWYKGGGHADGYADAGGGTELMHLVAGALYVNGALVPSSDRNAKENFTPVSPREVLDKVVALPISRWNFKEDQASEHLGPMAQDFRAAFGLGPDDKHIATVDADGVALAAIQGLNQKLEEQRAENSDLKQRLEKLEQLMNRQDGGAR